MNNDHKVLNPSLKAHFEERHWDNNYFNNESIIIPTVRSSRFFKYGKHVYYLYNFNSRKCYCVALSHWDIIRPGLHYLFKALGNKNRIFRLSYLFKKFHYGFNFLQFIMLSTVPHTVNYIGNGKFYINFWSYIGFIEVDCENKTAKYLRHNIQGDDTVLCSQQWMDFDENCSYHATFSLKESLKKIEDPFRPVSTSIFKEHISGKKEEIWKGLFSDYLHDIVVNSTKTYCAVCEMGVFPDNENNIIPSKVLILDLINKKHWFIDNFNVAAHAQFDPSDPNIIYFSNHCFKFVATSVIDLIRKPYSPEFTGNARVYKYRLTSEGPKELGFYSDVELFRMTNFHVFVHKKRKIIAAMGYPNYIFFAEADTLKTIKKIELQHKPVKSSVKPKSCLIGTLSPSTDGNYLYVQTSFSLQIIDVEKGIPIEYFPYENNHTAANHMITIHQNEI